VEGTMVVFTKKNNQMASSLVFPGFEFRGIVWTRSH